MAHGEIYSQEKNRLIEDSLRHKKELKKQVNSITKNTQEFTNNALVIGGALVLTYLAVRQFSAVKSKKKRAKEKVNSDAEGLVPKSNNTDTSFFSQIGDTLITHATIILLDLAKEKLSAYLENRKIKDENS